ncbi:MAG TPA: YceD family protein [Paenalcaligenes sp.]|nr:YceD family protein [Paenalcaligenes sp.]
MHKQLGSLDAFVFTEQAQRLSSQCSVTLFKRALKGLPEQPEGQQFDWALWGEVDSAGRHFLHVRLTGDVYLECQRCLETFAYPVQVDNTVQLVEDENEIELDEDDPEAIERILASRSFDGFDFLEDELILSLPYVAKHDQCPSMPKELTQDTQAEPSGKKENPFKVLKQLKKD